MVGTTVERGEKRAGAMVETMAGSKD